jgi:glycosyltransferase involved in cell wall biosynthesis
MNFSCIIACFNGENYLKEAIDSVMRQLGINDELIIVNDGSTDNTNTIISSFKDTRILPIHLIKNIGFSAARNEGLKIASKEYICFLDHDDLWPQNRQQLIINALNNNPDAGLIYGKIEQFFSPELKNELQKKYKIPPAIHSSFSGGVVIKRSIIKEAGLFDSNFKKGEWIDLLSKINRLQIIKIPINDTLLLRRIHDKNNSLQNKSMADYFPALKKHILRHK